MGRSGGLRRYDPIGVLPLKSSLSERCYAVQGYGLISLIEIRMEYRHRNPLVVHCFVAELLGHSEGEPLAVSRR